MDITYIMTRGFLKKKKKKTNKKTQDPVFWW